MSVDTGSFNAAKIGYIEQMNSLIDVLQEGMYLAFIKGGKKYAIRIDEITIDHITPDITIKASGVVWKGGLFSIDGVDVGDGHSACGYNASVSIVFMNNSSLWQDEISMTNYIAAYSREYPLELKGLIQAGTASFADDMWEVIEMKETDFYTALTNISECIAGGHFYLHYNM
jgi:hypothetical protein